MRIILKLVVALAAFLLSSQSALSQCVSPPNQCGNQTPIQCECVGTEYEFKVCHAGTEYIANVWMCTQQAVPPTPLDNPCTVPPNECAFPINSITWVKKICVPQELKDQNLTAVYQAIIRGTDLCCYNFIGATIPACNAGARCSDPTNPGIYCHVLALPKCLSKNFSTGCYTSCDNGGNCANHCFIERRYCKETPTSCCSFVRSICEGVNDPPCTGGSCNVVFNECCILGGGKCCSK
jgi:hypothetical protein